MMNPQVMQTPPKYTFRNVRKFLPRLKEMARKEWLTKEKEKKEEGGDGEDKKPLKVNTVLSVFNDEKVDIQF